MMLKTYLGVVDDESGLHYLRPETAQGIFINFLNVMQATRKKPPFGIAQTGKSFRNEITPGNFIFRTREFEQMEMEFFVKPGDDEHWHQYWIDERTRWYVDLGIDPDNLRHHEHPRRSSRTTPRANRHRVPVQLRGQRVGRARGHRQPHRLRPVDAHQALGTDLVFFDQTTNSKYTPYVIEPAAGLARSLMTFPRRCLHRGRGSQHQGRRGQARRVRLDPRLAPVKAAVLPLSRNEDLSPEGPRPRRPAAPQLEHRLRRQPGDRQALPPPGTRSARRSASPSTSTPWTTRP